MEPSTLVRAQKKPVVIEAALFTGGAVVGGEIVQWVLDNGGTARWSEAHDAWHSEDGIQSYPAQAEHLTIETLEGPMKAEVGWWILRGVEGEFYPCRADIFEKTYHIV